MRLLAHMQKILRCPFGLRSLTQLCSEPCHSHRYAPSLSHRHHVCFRSQPSSLQSRLLVHNTITSASPMPCPRPESHSANRRSPEKSSLPQPASVCVLAVADICMPCEHTTSAHGRHSRSLAEATPYLNGEALRQPIEKTAEAMHHRNL